MPESTVGRGDYPRILVPQQAWEHVERKVRQIDALRRQMNVLVDSLVETIEAVPEEGKG